MRPVFSVFRQYFLTNSRDKFSLFWSLVFPLVLMTILSLTLGNVEDPSGIRLAVSLINMDGDTTASFPGAKGPAAIIEEILAEASHQEDAWLQVIKPEEGVDLQDHLATELDALRAGDRHAVMLIPAGFSSGVISEVMAHFGPVSPEVDAPDITIYERAYDQPSEVAGSVLRDIVVEVNNEAAIQTGLIDRSKLAVLATSMVAAGDAPFNMADYLLPGIIIMSIMSTGLGTIVESLLAQRDRGILRRYFVTPVSTLQYFGGLLLYVLTLALVQVLLIYAFGAVFFGVNVALFSPWSLFYLVFSFVVLLSFGFLIASITKTANSGATLQNILFYPMMFLGGLFFPLEHLPGFLQAFVRVNPVTYLVNGLRDVLGVYPTFTDPTLNVAVPLAWLIFAVFFSLKRFRWEAK